MFFHLPSLLPSLLDTQVNNFYFSGMGSDPKPNWRREEAFNGHHLALDQSHGQKKGYTEKFRSTKSMSRNSTLGGCNKPVPLLQGQPWSCQKPQHGQCCCTPMQGALFSPTLHALYCSSVFHRRSHPLLGQASRARQGHCACLSSF